MRYLVLVILISSYGCLGNKKMIFTKSLNDYKSMDLVNVEKIIDSNKEQYIEFFNDTYILIKQVKDRGVASSLFVPICYALIIDTKNPYLVYELNQNTNIYSSEIKTVIVNSKKIIFLTNTMKQLTFKSHIISR